MKIILTLLILLWLLPIWCFSFLPFVDLPQHLAIAQIAHNFNSPSDFDYSQFFTLRFFPKAHILHTLFLHGVSFLVPMEIAGKVFVSLIVILLPISSYYFIKALGGNPAYSLLSFFFVYNYNLIWGFIAFCLGIPAFFFGLCLFLKYREQKGQGPKIGLNIALFLIFGLLLHAQIYFLLLLAFFIICCCKKCAGKEAAQRLAIVLPSLVFLFFCSYPIWMEKKGIILQNIPAFLPSLTFVQSRCLEFSSYLFSGRPVDKLLFWFILAVFFSLFLFGLIQVIRAKIWAFSGKDKVVYLLTLVFGVLYLALPADIKGVHNLIGPRLAIFIPLLLIGPLSRVRLSRLTPFVVTILLALAMLGWSLLRGFYQFNHQAKPVRALLEKTKNCRRLVELYTYPGRSGFFSHSFVHFGCYYTIWKDGLCGFIFPQIYPWHIVEMKEGANLPCVNVFSAWKSVFPQGWEEFDYFLICGQPTNEQEQWIEKADKLHLLGKEGIWRLYEKF